MLGFQFFFISTNSLMKMMRKITSFQFFFISTITNIMIWSKNSTFSSSLFRRIKETNWKVAISLSVLLYFDFYLSLYQKLKLLSVLLYFDICIFYLAEAEASFSSSLFRQAHIPNIMKFIDFQFFFISTEPRPYVLSFLHFTLFSTDSVEIVSNKRCFSILSDEGLCRNYH